MPQIKPFTVPATEVSQQSVEDISTKAARPGAVSAGNPPSTQQSYTVPLANATKVVGRATVQTGNPAGNLGVSPGQVVLNPGGLPADIMLMSDAPPPIPSTGTVPFFSPVESPRVDANLRTVNDTPPTLSVNLTERFINEAIGDKPLTPNVISRPDSQIVTDARPQGPADESLRGTNPVGSGPIITPQPPTVTPPIAEPPYAGN